MIWINLEVGGGGSAQFSVLSNSMKIEMLDGRKHRLHPTPRGGGGGGGGGARCIVSSFFCRTNFRKAWLIWVIMIIENNRKQILSFPVIFHNSSHRMYTQWRMHSHSTHRHRHSYTQFLSRMQRSNNLRLSSAKHKKDAADKCQTFVTFILKLEVRGTREDRKKCWLAPLSTPVQSVDE